MKRRRAFVSDTARRQASGDRSRERVLMKLAIVAGKSRIDEAKIAE